MSLVAFKAQNHPQQESIDTVDDRGTRREFFDPLHARHDFTVDVAASEANALLPRYFTRAVDGLAQTWGGERVYCNPPYSRIAPWPEKAWIEMVDGTCELVVMLLPANRCEQGWWQTHVEPYRDRAPFHGVSLRVDFLPGRMRFVMPEDYAWGTSRKKGDRPPFGCVLLTWSRVAAPAPYERKTVATMAEYRVAVEEWNALGRPLGRLGRPVLDSPDCARCGKMRVDAEHLPAFASADRFCLCPEVFAGSHLEGVR